MSNHEAGVPTQGPPITLPTTPHVQGCLGWIDHPGDGRRYFCTRADTHDGTQAQTHSATAADGTPVIWPDDPSQAAKGADATSGRG